MSIDEPGLEGLIEASQDIHSDAMASTKESLTELVEAGHERRSNGEVDREDNRALAADRRRVLQKSLTGAGLLAAGGFGAALLGMMDSPAFADVTSDVRMLQTNASLEVLAVSVYKTALGLPFIANGNPVVKTFATMTMSQHNDHLQAFNAAATQLGGAPQNNPDPAVVPVVQQALPGIKGPADVVSLAIKLENTAAETYIADLPMFSNSNARKVTASIMGVEAQHAAVLYAVQALLQANAADLISLAPGTAAKLPAAAGSVGFPNTFYPTDLARPSTEGAVK